MASHLDFETFSECPLGGPKGLGQYRYANDPSTEILLCAISEDDSDKVFLWVNPKYETPELRSDPEALQRIQNAATKEEVIYAHNAPFEAAVSKYLWKKTFKTEPPKLEQWRCTMAMARRAAIPSSLEMVGEFLGLPSDAQKDKRGKALIKRFCSPITNGKRKGERFLPTEDLVAFAEFGEYCRQDVVSEKAVHKALTAFELTGEVLEAFQFDLRMNDRGIPVNVDALEEAERIVDDYIEKATARFQGLTGLSPTQGVKFLEWLQQRGYPGNDLTRGTRDGVLSQDPDSLGMDREAFEALEVHDLVTFAAVKKIPKMRKAACLDGYVRGALIWSGAERTHRWAGSLIQPQNFRRPTVKGTAYAYKLICEKKADPEAFEVLFGPFLETVASCIRHFIHPINGFLDADYSAIEARINPWLCGQEDTLDCFRRGDPIYEMMGSRIFQIPVESIGKDSLERFVGKQATLGCGYQMGPPKFRQTCVNFGQDISDQLAEKAVYAWRAANPIIVDCWKSIDEAAKAAIRNPGKIYCGTPLTGRIKFGMTEKAGFPALVMILPSGHKLIYPRARIRRVKKKYQGREYESDEIQFWGKLPGKGGKKWGWLSTYGGNLLENATQATAGDIMTNGALIAEKRGFEIAMLVHDQALDLWREGHTNEAFCEALCTLPPWAEGLPIEAEGGFAPFYRK